MSAKVIAIINQKGGVGKTSMTFQVGSILKKVSNYRVLLIDMDPQCNLSSIMGADTNNYSILDALLGNVEAEFIIQHCKYSDIIVSNGNLASYEKRFVGEKAEYRLKQIIEPLKDMYDFILIDSPPALSVLTVGILTASDGFVIPATADIYSIQGITQIHETYLAVKEYTNPNLEIYGVAFSRYNFEVDAKIFKSIKNVCEELEINLFPVIIRESVDIRISLLYSQSLLDYAPESGVLKDYMLFVKHLLRKLKGSTENGDNIKG